MNAFDRPHDFALDSANNRALVVSNRTGALIAVDLLNGQRVFVSR